MHVCARIVRVYVVKFRLEETHFWWSAFKSAYYLRCDLIFDNKLNLHQCAHVQRTKEFPVCIVPSTATIILFHQYVFAKVFDGPAGGCSSV